MPAKKNPEAVPGKNIAAKIPADLYAALDDRRWQDRTTMSALIVAILSEWAAKQTAEYTG